MMVLHWPHMAAIFNSGGCNVAIENSSRTLSQLFLTQEEAEEVTAIEFSNMAVKTVYWA